MLKKFHNNKHLKYRCLYKSSQSLIPHIFFRSWTHILEHCPAGKYNDSPVLPEAARFFFTFFGHDMQFTTHYRIVFKLVITVSNN